MFLCFSNVLSDTNKQERFNLTTQDNGLLNFTLMLPNDMTCCQCILQVFISNIWHISVSEAYIILSRSIHIFCHCTFVSISKHQWEYIAGIKRYRACSDISIADNKTSVSEFNRDCAGK